MTTITWSITAMDCYPLAQGQADVVFNVHWTCNGTQDTYSASIINTCQVEFTGGAYTPYDQLTQEQVLGWIWSNGVDQSAVETAVEQMVQQQANPPVVTPPLPWSA
jgi:hypothetical protein